MIRLLSILCISFLIGCTTIAPEEMIGKPVKLTSYPMEVFISRGIMHPQMLSFNDQREIYKGKLLNLDETTITIGLLDDWETGYEVDWDELLENPDQEQAPWLKGKGRINYSHKITIRRDSIEKIELIK